MFDLTFEGGVARLSLSRPEARNAIPAADWPLLADRAAQAEQAGARLLLVTGTEAAFCAGADLDDFASMTGDAEACASFRLAMRRGLDALRSASIPVIALVEGPCYGAGVALAMACDMRLAGPAARFAITPARMGISYPQEDVHALVRLVGPGQAARLLFSTSAVDAEEALRIGLVDQPAEALEPLIGAILGSDAASLKALKRGIRLAEEGVRSDPEQDRLFDSLIGSQSFADRLADRRKR